MTDLTYLMIIMPVKKQNITSISEPPMAPLPSLPLYLSQEETPILTSIITDQFCWFLSLVYQWNYTTCTHLQFSLSFFFFFYNKTPLYLIILVVYNICSFGLLYTLTLNDCTTTYPVNCWWALSFFLFVVLTKNAAMNLFIPVFWSTDSFIL